MAISTDLRQDREIALRLQRAWSAFFESFGRLTPVQRDVIPEVLQGRDLLVCSATASGKTEAVCAPLIERFLDLAKPWTILYISPTRALVNDLYARLEVPLQRLSLKLSRRTGEYHGDVKKEVPNVLLTTPESFDSILCRGRRPDSLGHVLSGVVALVLDEIHLLFGTPRGEQVRYLVERLRRLRREAKLKGWASSDGFQTIGLSATIPDPDAVLSLFIPQGRAIVVPGGREIDVVTMPGEKLYLYIDDAIPAYLASCAEPQKLLVFSNSRRRVDDLAFRLTPKLRELGYKVGVHHGSLSKNVRLATEEVAKTESGVVIFATSTLEIGIDIGDIDLVVLDEPPPDVPALLQRIGRGNRRSNETWLMICPRSRAESIIHSAMIDAARDGWLGPSEHGPYYAVARQQIASYIFQSRRRSRTRNKILSFLECSVEPFIGRSILDHMVETGELKEDAEGIRLGEEWEERATYGKIHSNIEDNPEMTVVDEESGKKIAKGVVYRGGKGLHIGGQMLQVRKCAKRKIEVRRVVVDKKIPVGEWAYSARKWVAGAGQPQAVRRYLGIKEDEWPVVAGDNNYVFHFGGARRRAIIELAASLEPSNIGSIKINEWFLEMPAGPIKAPSWLLRVGPGTLEIIISDRINLLERRLGRPLANRSLPIDVRVEELRRWLRIEDELAYIKSCRWVRVEDNEVKMALLSLVKSQ